MLPQKLNETCPHQFIHFIFYRRVSKVFRSAKATKMMTRPLSCSKTEWIRINLIVHKLSGIYQSTGELCKISMKYSVCPLT